MCASISMQALLSTSFVSWQHCRWEGRKVSRELHIRMYMPTAMDVLVSNRFGCVHIRMPILPYMYFNIIIKIVKDPFYPIGSYTPGINIVGIHVFTCLWFTLHPFVEDLFSQKIWFVQNFLCHAHGQSNVNQCGKI